jgi:hypothetical protein
MTEQQQTQVEAMLQQIKAMEPVIGKARVQKFTKNTLRAQLRKKVITETEYADLMTRLGYE